MSAAASDGSEDMRTVVFGIDGVVSDNRWRSGNSALPFDEYHSLSVRDEPYRDTVEVIARLSEHYHVVGLTSMPLKFRKLRMNWLLTHGVAFDELLMRPDNEFRKEAELKAALVGELKNVICAFDDRDDVVEAYRAMNILAFQVYPERMK